MFNDPSPGSMAWGEQIWTTHHRRRHNTVIHFTGRAPRLWNLRNSATDFYSGAQRRPGKALEEKTTGSEPLRGLCPDRKWKEMLFRQLGAHDWLREASSTSSTEQNAVCLDFRSPQQKWESNHKGETNHQFKKKCLSLSPSPSRTPWMLQEPWLLL